MEALGVPSDTLLRIFREEKKRIEGLDQDPSMLTWQLGSLSFVSLKTSSFIFLFFPWCWYTSSHLQRHCVPGSRAIHSWTMCFELLSNGSWTNWNGRCDFWCCILLVNCHSLFIDEGMDRGGAKCIFDGYASGFVIFDGPRIDWNIGVADETGTLQEGEIFCQIQPLSESRSTVAADCMIYRNPCRKFYFLTPELKLTTAQFILVNKTYMIKYCVFVDWYFMVGDVRRVRAVACDAVSHHINVVVFSTQGKRPLPNM